MRIAALLCFFLATNLHAEEKAPGCTPLVENFCRELHSPARQGSWDLKSGKNVLKIRRGPIANDFSYSYFRAQQLLLENAKHLPTDFSAELEKVGYFPKLKKYLSAKPLRKHTEQERVAEIHNTGVLESLWYSALRSTALRRMNKKYPGFHKLRTRDRPPFWRLEENRMHSELRIEANRARWENSPEWRTAQKQFEDVRAELIAILAKAKGMSEAAREANISRLRAVKLLSPGSTENHLDDGCFDIMDNAFYSSSTNSVQVCAGLITSTTTIFTMAHELAHAVDPYAVIYSSLTGSVLGKAITEIKEVQCSGKVYPCERWKAFKESFSALAERIPAYRPDPAGYYQCFQRKELKEPDADYYPDHVRRWVTNDLESLSKSSTFIKLVKKDAELMNGKTYPNPAYLNPCGLDNWVRTYDDYPVNTITPLILHFTAEYTCTPDMPAQERMSNAIETAKELQLVFNQRYATVPGRFSAITTFTSDGHAEDVGERVADALGSEVLAKMLSRIPSLEGRRMQFYSTLADRCEEPSWKTRFPEEAEVENKYSWDPHTAGMKRIFETMPASVREQVQCEKDFELKECVLE